MNDMRNENDIILCEKLEWVTPIVEKMLFTRTKSGSSAHHISEFATYISES